MKNLEQYIAQTKADIKAIPLEIAGLRADAEALLVEKEHLEQVLAKLEAPDVVATEEETPSV